jgi:hypothetical protein
MDSGGRTLSRSIADVVLYLSVGTGVAQAVASWRCRWSRGCTIPGISGQFGVFNAILGLLRPLALLRYERIQTFGRITIFTLSLDGRVIAAELIQITDSKLELMNLTCDPRYARYSLDMF